MQYTNSKTSGLAAAAKLFTLLTNTTSVAFLCSFYGLHAPQFLVCSSIPGLARTVLFLWVSKKNGVAQLLVTKLNSSFIIAPWDCITSCPLLWSVHDSNKALRSPGIFPTCSGGY